MTPLISGFTVIRNARLMGYPVLESIRSLLPLVDEMVIGVGQSDDDTKAMIESIGDPKIRIFDSIWDTKKTKGGLILSEKTNEALDQCKHDWCFYLQADEVLHETDLIPIRNAITQAQTVIDAKKADVEGLLFRYIHFYGSYSTIATSRRWYRNEVRVIRRLTGARSYNDAQGFRIPTADGGVRKLKVVQTNARVFHYGWVKPPKMMGQKNKLINRWWHGNKRDNEFDNFEYARQYGLRPYNGPHPAVMRELVAKQDWTFDHRRRLSDWTLKDVNLWASDALEAVTGYRIGEYKPYRLMKTPLGG